MAKEKPEVEETPEVKPKGKKPPAPDIVIVDKFVKRSVGGLVFWNPKIKAFLGVQAWVEAKTPDEAYIYDTMDNLTTCSIPLSDVRVVNGLAVRMPPKKPKPTKVNIAYAVLAKAPESKAVVERIQDANTKDHHTMTY